MRQQGGKEKKNVKVSLTVVNVQRNSVFGRYSVADMVARMKGLAWDPCRPQFARDNIQPLYNQMLRVRKVMALKDSDIPWRKWKFEQFVKDKLKAPSGFIVPDQQNIRKLRKHSSDASSASCLLNSVGSTKHGGENILSNSRISSSLLKFDDTFTGNPVATDCSSVVHSSCHINDVSPTLDSDESMDASNALSPEFPTPKDAPSVKINNATLFLRSPTSDGPNRKHLQSPRRSIRLQNFIGDHLQRCVIPIGPRFQADVPMWNGLKNKGELISKYKKDFNNSKWLGTRVWPIQIGNMKSIGSKVGKGRPNSCRCVSPGSIDCIRCHLYEKRLFLQCDIGPAFFTWKFDEMGERVLNSWTLKEQKTFESLVKTRPSSQGKNFLKQALKRFSNKSRKDIVNYYFGVYIPQSMSIHTRSPSLKLVEIESEDEEEDFNYMGIHKRSKVKTIIMSNSEDVKAHNS